MKLRLRVRPKAGEGVRELALRLAHRGGHQSLAEFKSVHRLQFSAVTFARDAEKLAALSGMPLAPLLEWSARPDLKHGKVFRSAAIASSTHIFSRVRRFCPHCLDADFTGAEPHEPDASAAFLRGSWPLNILYACPVHRCAMLNSCPGCKGTIPYDALPLYRCPCGFELRHAPTAQLDDEHMTAFEYMLGRLEMADRIETPTLDAIPLWQVANVLRRIGSAVVLGKRDTVQISVGQIDQDLSYDQEPAKLAALMSQGFQYAREGRESLARLVQVMIKGEQRLVSGPTALFGLKFRTWLIHEDNPIRSEIRHVWDGLAKNHGRPHRSPKAPVIGRLDHLAKRPQSLHPLEHRRFEAEVNSPFELSASRRHALKAGRVAQKVVSSHEAIELIGVSSGVMSMMVRFGLLTPAWYSDITSAPALYVRDLLTLRDHVAAQEVDFCSRLWATRLFGTSRRAHLFSSVVLLARAMRGELPIAWSRGEERLLKAVVYVDRLRPLKELAALTPRDVAGFLSVSESDIPGLASCGLFGSGTPCAESIGEEQVNAFLQSYISPRRLGLLCSSRMEPHLLADWLMETGLRSMAPQGCGAVFERQAAIEHFYRHWNWDVEHSLTKAAALPPENWIVLS